MTTTTTTTTATVFTSCGMEIPKFAIDLATTKEGFTPEEAWQLAGDYSDGFKDLNGFRPRSLTPDTIDGILEDFAQWREDSEREEIERKAELESNSRRIQRAKAAKRRLGQYRIGDLFPAL